MREDVLQLLYERGFIKYSTIMVRFHVSSVEAKHIVAELVKNGIINEKGIYLGKTIVPPKRNSSSHSSSKRKAKPIKQDANEKIIETKRPSIPLTPPDIPQKRKRIRKNKEIKGQLSLFNDYETENQ